MADQRAGHVVTNGPRAQRSTLGWVAFLVGPIAWILQLIGSWTIGEVIACAPAARPAGEILGLHVNAFVGIVDAVLLALTVLAGVGAFLELRAIRSTEDRSPGHRATWLATAGLMTSVLFAILIASSFVPIGMISGCS